jgi:hypothetical protein
MVMKKSIGRTLSQIDVVANASVRIHEDFFSSHRDYHHRSQDEIAELRSSSLQYPREFLFASRISLTVEVVSLAGGKDGYDDCESSHALYVSG